jgi:putative membrane protein
MVSWFAVLFYLPRLFVYHAENADNAGFIEVIKVMEMKIYKYIGVPAFWATLLSGLLLIYLATDHYGVSIFKMGLVPRQTSLCRDPDRLLLLNGLLP